MCFYLGTHQPHWLREVPVPLFVSRRRLVGYKTLPRAICHWAMDSGGFTELDMYGTWSVSLEQYIEDVRRIFSEVGLMDWAAIQDWMCEPWIVKKTGRSVEEHQQLTVRSFLDLKEKAPEIPWAPVLQGWNIEDYERCWEMYRRAGVDLVSEKIVGLGSVCRRHKTKEVKEIVSMFASRGVRLHGFGVKTIGLKQCADSLVSADSMAWSLSARKRPALPGCEKHKNCANCRHYALLWRREIVEGLPERWQQ